MTNTDILFGSLTIVSWIVLFAVILIPSLRRKVRGYLQTGNNISFATLALSLTAMLGSLWYSEIVDYQPCLLCWYQRIFMYPIVVTSFISIVYKDLRGYMYAKGLAMIGIVISIYHLIQQRLPQTGLSCGAVGQATSCDSLWVNAFGIVTIPAMAGTIFAIILYVIYLRQSSVVSIDKVSTSDE